MDARRALKIGRSDQPIAEPKRWAEVATAPRAAVDRTEKLLFALLVASGLVTVAVRLFGWD
jgi:hypothetical protein